MTVLEAVIDQVRRACPGFKVDWGFHADLVSFLAESRISGPTIFVGIGTEQPEEYREDSVVDAWNEVYVIGFRTAGDKKLDLYQQYITLREALNGKSLNTEDGPRTSTIIAGERAREKGYNDAALTIEVG
jgi:hypothetical protein